MCTSTLSELDTVIYILLTSTDGGTEAAHKRLAVECSEGTRVGGGAGFGD